MTLRFNLGDCAEVVLAARFTTHWDIYSGNDAQGANEHIGVTSMLGYRTGPAGSQDSTPDASAHPNRQDASWSVGKP
jgi:hypothetical protein